MFYYGYQGGKLIKLPPGMYEINDLRKKLKHAMGNCDENESNATDDEKRKQRNCSKDNGKC